ncbi:MAG: guanylate kinase [SAR202 cluster bacterium]|nr:guanylate kinase [SAR202 cluster bacterium]
MAASSDGTKQAPHARRPLLVVISGPSGVGKDAVLHALRASHPELFFTVTATTRPRRAGEVDGHDYIFLTNEQFEEFVERGELLEHAQVYGRWYGVPKWQVRNALARGQDAIVKVDVQGASTIRKGTPDAVLIFLAPPSMEELERRLRSRKTEDDEQLRLRMQTAALEMQQARCFDYVIENETGAIDDTVARVIEAMEREREKHPNREVRL